MSRPSPCATAISQAETALRTKRFAGSRNHANDRRRDLGLWLERLGRHVEHRHHRIANLKHHRQTPVVGRARFGDHARDDFLLQHEVLIDHAVCNRMQMKQQRRRDVVRQIADDAQTLAIRRARKSREVEAKRIGFMHDDFTRIETIAQTRHEIAIEFDGVKRMRDVLQ